MRRLLALVLSLCSVAALAATPDEELQSLVEIFKAGKGRHAVAAEELEWKGFTDPQLFDLIHQHLLSDFEAARASKPEKQRVARYIRALGFSGQPKYAVTLSRFAEDPDYRGYSERALLDLPLYAKWNPLIADRGAFNPKVTDDGNRVMNMLRSDDLMLNRLGAKRVFFREQQDEVVDVLAARLSASYTAAEDRETTDAVAWMAKSLGRAGSARHRAILAEVARNTSNDKVAREADTALKALAAR